MNKKDQQKRSDAALLLAIVLGLVLGMLIKKVKLGILLGLILAGIILFTGWLRSSRK